MSKKRRTGRHNAGTISVIFILLVFLAVMSVQIYRLRQKDKQYAQTQQKLEEQLADETQRQQEIEDMNQNKDAIEYVIEWAHKLGFTFDDEILFKENDE